MTDAEVNISYQGFCRKHGEERRDANNAQLEAKRGPFYDHWVRRSYLEQRKRLAALAAKAQ